MSERTVSPDFDVLILGAGLYGIQAARFYLTLHPKANVAILEADEVVGGTWSSKRIYDVFWTQTPIGMAEFSDRPMLPPPKDQQHHGFFPAKYVTEYLETYIDNHIYNGQTLRDKIHFNTNIEHIAKTPDNLWTVSCSGNESFKSPHLIDATGMTSQPNLPSLPGLETFQGLSLHHKDFGQSDFLTDASRQHVAVLGGAKSAADVAYMAAKAGKTVSWIIREEGSGPAAFLACEGKGPYRNSNEGFYNRFVGSFLPCPFGGATFLPRALHRSRVGRWVVGRFWDGVDSEHRRTANFGREEGRKMGFGNLEPDTPIFWQNDSSGVNQRPDFYSTIATKVHVYRQSIDRLSTHSVTLAPRAQSEEGAHTLPLDVLVYCTGWTPISPRYSPASALQLGLPVSLTEADPKTLAKWQELEDAKDHKVLSSFSSLRHPPVYRKAQSSHTPFRLYKAMVPASDALDHSIVFLGKMVVGNNFRTAEVQAFWAVAYLDGKLKCEKPAMEDDIAETIAWCRRRYLNKGQLGSWYYFDVVSYTDMLLAQLGLSSHRRKGWFRNLFAPCMASDLKDLESEYKALYGV